MKNYVPKILLLVIGAAIATIALPTRNQFGQESSGGPQRANLRKQLSKHSALPPVARFDEPAVPQDPQDQERRQSRSRLSKGLYTQKVILDPGVREVNGQAEGINLTFVDGVTILKPGELPDPIGLPISGSIIVIGTATSGKAYVNQEHTGVFSEYRLAITDVLKPDTDSVISARDEITAWLPGGTLQFQSGHITHFIIAGCNYPEIGTQYVFFLRRPDKTVKDYAISTAFSIKDQVVLPLDDGNDKRSFEGMPVTDFLDKLRREISIRRDRGKAGSGRDTTAGDVATPETQIPTVLPGW
jgi:hypothetical protein